MYHTLSAAPTPGVIPQSPMPNPTSKQLLVRTLVDLRKARTKTLMRIKALQRQGEGLSAKRDQACLELEAIEAKMSWEINTNGKALKDRE